MPQRWTNAVEPEHGTPGLPSGRMGLDASGGEPLNTMFSGGPLGQTGRSSGRKIARPRGRTHHLNNGSFGVFGVNDARSFYLLGPIEERRGNDARARLQYEKFLDLWREGDLERGWVADAEKKVTRAPSP